MLKKIALISTALLIAVAFTGCSKKPRRPNPIDTVMGPGTGGGTEFVDTSLNPESYGGGGDGTTLAIRNSSGNWADEVRSGVLGDASTVYFNFDSTSISPEERAKLNEAAAYMQRNPNAKILLEGHCDWRGTGEYNLALGDRRAKSIQTFLETLSISSDRLQTVSKGDLESTDGASSAQMARERKVELLVAN